MIIVNDDWQTAKDKGQVVNVAGDDVLPLEIEFRTSEVEITVAPLVVEGNTIVRWPTSRKEAMDLSSFKDDTRRLRLTDPPRHMFILMRAR
jgi:hypothetical protein